MEVISLDFPENDFDEVALPKSEVTCLLGDGDHQGGSRAPDDLGRDDLVEVGHRITPER